MSEMMDRELGWDDTIEKESDYVVLPEGDYDFTVESFERGRHNGSDKLPPCNKATLKLRVVSSEGEATITHNLFLHTITEGMLSAFFSSIGQKKKGEPLRMNWNMVPGSTGRAHIAPEADRNDPTKKYNRVKRFYPKEPKKFEAGRF